MGCQPTVGWFNIKSGSSATLLPISMMKTWHGNIFHITGPLWGESPWLQRPVMQSFDVFFDVRQNKLLNNQWICQLFEMLWHSCNALSCHNQFSIPYRNFNKKSYSLKFIDFTIHEKITHSILTLSLVMACCVRCISMCWVNTNTSYSWFLITIKIQ